MIFTNTSSGSLLSSFQIAGLPFDAVHALKVRVDNAEANGHRVVPTSFNLRLRVRTFIFCQDVQNLLDLPIRLCTTISPCHAYNRLSAHVMISMAASKKTFASCAAMVPGVYRMSVDQELTRAKCGTTEARQTPSTCEDDSDEQDSCWGHSEATTAKRGQNRLTSPMSGPRASDGEARELRHSDLLHRCRVPPGYPANSSSSALAS